MVGAAPPPVIVVQNLKTLLQNGYQILGRNIEAKNPELETIFRNENITSHNVTSSLVPGTWGLDLRALTELLTYCNSTVSTNAQLVSSSLLQMKNIHPELLCHYSKETTISEDMIFTIHGHVHRLLAKTVIHLQEAGIVRLIYEYNRFILKLPYFRNLEILEFKDRSLREPFKMRDWKILSIFLGWASSLLGLGFLILGVELLFNYRSVLKNVYAAIRNTILSGLTLVKPMICVKMSKKSTPTQILQIAK